MPSLICTVVNQKGLHARAAAQVISLVSDYDCDVFLTHKSQRASARSLLKLLTLNAPIGSEILVEVKADKTNTGAAQELLKKLQTLFAQGFNE